MTTLDFKSRLTGFHQAVAETGHAIPNIIVDSTKRFERIPCSFGRNRNKNIAYWVRPDKDDGRLYGYFQCHSCGSDPITWIEITNESLGHRKLSDNELRAKRKEMFEDLKIQAGDRIATQQKVAESAMIQWQEAISITPTITTLYLTNKKIITPYFTAEQITAWDLRKWGDELLVSLYDVNDKHWNIERVNPDSFKKTETGGRVAGLFHPIGEINPDGVVQLAEGVVTGIVCHAATGITTLCCRNADNMVKVAYALKEAYPNIKLHVCADDDRIKFEKQKHKAAELKAQGKKVNIKPENKGLSVAYQIAKKFNARVSKPDISLIGDDVQLMKLDSPPSDFHDVFYELSRQEKDGTASLSIVKQQIQKYLNDEEIMTEDAGKTTIINTEKVDKPKKSELLLQLIDLGGFKFFHDEQEVTYCRFISSKSNVMETRRIIDRDFKNYLTLIFRREFGKTIGDTSMREVLSELEGRALFDGPKEKVYLRTGEHNGTFYIDLCNDAWQAVELSANGWKVLESTNIPIRFKRTPHMKPLPMPTDNQKGAVSLLFKSLNIPAKDRILVLANMIDAFRCTTNYTILAIVGLQGSGKSFNQEVLRQFVDPNVCNSRTAPRKNDDMVIDASTNHVVSYGNVSFLSAESQDDLCNMSTGGGFARRTLYASNEQTVSDICKPVMINGITNPLTRPDALDRGVIIELDVIDENKRKTEEELKREIQKKSRIIFTGLLNLFSKALKKLPEVTLQKKTRMADFALLGCAIEKAYGLTEGVFIGKYLKNRKEAQENVLDAAPVVQALVDFINICSDGYWRGTPSNLLKILNERETPSINMTWPKSGRGMSDALKRYIYPLKQVGINVFPEPKRSENGFCYQISKISIHESREGGFLSTGSTGSTADKSDPNNHGASQGEHGAVHENPSTVEVQQSTAEVQEVQPKYRTKYSPPNPRGVCVPESFDVNPVLPVLKNPPSRSYGVGEIDDSGGTVLIQ